MKNASHFCTGSTGSTTADLILKTLEKNLNPQSVKVSAVMSTPSSPFPLKNPGSSKMPENR